MGKQKTSDDSVLFACSLLSFGAKFAILIVSKSRRNSRGTFSWCASSFAVSSALSNAHFYTDGLSECIDSFFSDDLPNASFFQMFARMHRFQ